LNKPAEAAYEPEKNVRFYIAIIVAVAAIATYMAASQAVHGIGFPLDDAWIHQTYARNLAAFREWAFIPGQPSAGSTAPLWSVILSAGYILNLSPYFWTFFLGTVSLCALAIFGEMWFRKVECNIKSLIPWAGIFLAGEWHLTWSAASGMETTLFALIILVVFNLLSRKERGWIVGVLIGVSVWIRPDGITLLGPALFQYLLEGKSWKERMRNSAWLILPCLVPVAGYLLFNQSISNTWLPNTFFAKQAEYAIYQQLPILDRLLSLIELPLIGAGALLLPGFLFFIWKSIKNRAWGWIAAELWWFGYILIYALRLPVTYQHGRYLIPSMPVFFVLGMAGLVYIYKALRRRNTGILPSQQEPRWLRLGRFGWTTASASIWLSMIAIGAFTYAQDVAIIDSEMVATSQWIASNTPANAIIGAHDIGALGYFSNRRILDLAGLVSPDVIPFIRDETALGNYLTAQGASYLMTFPSWYPQLVHNRQVLFQTGGKFSIAAGGDNMTVFQWP
jgi:hypothetical protein